MELTVFDVEHGAAALMRSRDTNRLALIDCGHNSYTGWTPARYIKNKLQRHYIDYLIITNTDQDHYSNLAVLLDEVTPSTLYYNPDVSPETFELLKRQTGPLSRDAEAYLEMRRSYTSDVTVPFNDGMGGIIQDMYWNSPSDFSDFNNLSLVSFYKFGGFQILFPGDLERPGWLKLLQNPRFVARLRETTVLIAPHHGRINQNFCEEVFDYLHPQLVVISDKPIEHTTQVDSASVYRRFVREPGIHFADIDRYRKVLTTRKDGAMHFSVDESGSFFVTTGIC